MISGIKLGIVIPAYNEEELITITLNNMPNYVDSIYVTDDCSKDQTSKIVKDYMIIDKRIKLIQHEVNQGVGGAIISGFKKAIQEGIDIVVVMAGDNQMDAKYLPILLKPILTNEADFTKGNRLKPKYWKGMSPFRLFGNIILTILNKFVSGYWNIKDPQNGYIAIKTSCLKKIDLNKLYKGYAFENDLMLKMNIHNVRMKNVLIPAKYGKETSNINYFKFIFKTGFFLTKGYFWRIWIKYIKYFKIIGFLFIMGLLTLMVGSITSIIFSITTTWSVLLIGAIILLGGIFSDGISSYFY